MAPREEKIWSSLAHLSIFLNLLVPFAGLVAALVIRLVSVHHSSRVSFHALQALWYQVLWFLLGLGALLLTGFTAMLVVCAVSLIIPIKAAYEVNRGVDYRYPAAAYLGRYR